jgi:hypothetical protein
MLDGSDMAIVVKASMLFGSDDSSTIGGSLQLVQD